MPSPSPALPLPAAAAVLRHVTVMTLVVGLHYKHTFACENLQTRAFDAKCRTLNIISDELLKECGPAKLEHVILARSACAWLWQVVGRRETSLEFLLLARSEAMFDAACRGHVDRAAFEDLMAFMEVANNALNDVWLDRHTHKTWLCVDFARYKAHGRLPSLFVVQHAKPKRLEPGMAWGATPNEDAVRRTMLAKRIQYTKA